MGRSQAAGALPMENRWVAMPGGSAAMFGGLVPTADAPRCDRQRPHVHRGHRGRQLGAALLERLKPVHRTNQRESETRVEL